MKRRNYLKTMLAACGGAAVVRAAGAAPICTWT